MATTQEYLLGTAVTLMSTELNSLATSSGFTAGAIASVGGTSGVFNNTAGGGSLGGYAFGLFELDMANVPGGTMVVNSVFNIYLLGTVDGGTKFEAGSASLIPIRAPDASIRFFNDALVHTLHSLVVPLKLGNWKVVVSHNGGFSLNATLNTLKVLPATWQGV